MTEKEEAGKRPKRHWYLKLAINDYLQDTSDLEYEEHGFYLIALMRLWQNGGFLTKEKFRKIEKISPKKFEKKFKKVEKFFTFYGDEFTQKRLISEMDKDNKIRKKREESGKRGAQKRWEDMANAIPEEDGKRDSKSIAISELQLESDSINNIYVKKPDSDLSLIPDVNAQKVLNGKLNQKIKKYDIVQDEVVEEAVNLPPIPDKEIQARKRFKEEQNKREAKKDRIIENRAKSVFDEARKIWPGTKRGLDMEWENFKKKCKTYRVVVYQLPDAIEKQAEHYRKLGINGHFVPSWQNFKTWINNADYTREFEEPTPINQNNNRKTFAEMEDQNLERITSSLSEQLGHISSPQNQSRIAQNVSQLQQAAGGENSGRKSTTAGRNPQIPPFRQN